MKTTETVSLEKLEAQFKELAQNIYDRGEVRIQPTWPWVLVRVCPRAQKFGSLYLPDGTGSKGQNKPLWEGIVLETWKPHWSKRKQIKKGSEFKESEREFEVWMESDFKRGDRVVFPHFAGLPVKYFDERNYRLIREWTFDPDGGVLCILNYDDDKKYGPVLDKLFEDLQSKTISGK